MRILIAPQAFKGTLTAQEAAHAMREGVLRAKPSAAITVQPIADGGDGTLDILLGSSGKRFSTAATDALGRVTEATWGVMGDGQTAVIELARICGLARLAVHELDVLRATSFGLGQVMKDALDQGFRRLIIGLGGSASHDAGTGAMKALGVRFLDACDAELPPGGAALRLLAQIDKRNLDPRLREAEITLACDVANPIMGGTGATTIYASQKGATKNDIIVLEESLQHFCRMVQGELNTDIRYIPYGGAAGGVAAGMYALLGAHLDFGAEIILKALKLDEILSKIDLVITGEGSLDVQTLFGKAPFALAQLAKQHKVPIIAIAGTANATGSFSSVFQAVFSTSQEPLKSLPDRETAMKAVATASEQAMHAL
jgi:glycerate kinase